jgi:hypothetical protein
MISNAVPMKTFLECHLRWVSESSSIPPCSASAIRTEEELEQVVGSFGTGGRGGETSDIRVEHKLRVLENRMLRIFGPKRDAVTGGWKILHNEELHNLYLIKSRRIRSAGNVAHMGRRAMHIGFLWE